MPELIASVAAGRREALEAAGSAEATCRECGDHVGMTMGVAVARSLDRLPMQTTDLKQRPRQQDLLAPAEVRQARQGKRVGGR